MRHSILLVLLITVSMVSCNREAKVNSESKIEAAHHHQSDTVTIELNNGAKWKVDDSMMVYIRKMENDVIAFQESDSVQYESLAIKLQTNLDLLTSNCTMKGKAHDELHKWLLPYIELVTSFSETSNKNEAEKKLQDIRISFTTFNHCFQ